MGARADDVLTDEKLDATGARLEVSQGHRSFD
jgi:hypothetical protein